MKLENTNETTDNTPKSGVENTVDLSSESVRASLEKRISQEIDEYCVKAYDDGMRWHLGASVIGDECSRKLWYLFRWVGHDVADGRMYRLWQRGHREEPIHAEYLRGIGFQIWSIDENTGKQFKIQKSCSGHFGGSLDHIARFPPSWGIDEPVLVSCKTNGTGAGFNKVVNEPLAKAKPQHFIQESVYGRNYGIKYVVYLNTNKNDDSLAVKVEKLDFKLAEEMEKKAEAIIFSRVPPARLSDNPTFFECKNLCKFKEVCHHGKPALRNCRSCIRCRPIDGGEFFCEQWEATIPRDAVLHACQSYQSITVGNE